MLLCCVALTRSLPHRSRITELLDIVLGLETFLSEKSISRFRCAYPSSVCHVFQFRDHVLERPVRFTSERGCDRLDPNG